MQPVERSWHVSLRGLRLTYRPVNFGLYVSDKLTLSRQVTLAHHVDDTAVTATSDQPGDMSTACRIAITICQDYGGTVQHDRRTWPDIARYLVVTLDIQTTWWTHVA
jgi:hypothetical protein